MVEPAASCVVMVGIFFFIIFFSLNDWLILLRLFTWEGEVLVHKILELADILKLKRQESVHDAVGALSLCLCQDVACQLGQSFVRNLGEDATEIGLEQIVGQGLHQGHKVRADVVGAGH